MAKIFCILIVLSVASAMASAETLVCESKTEPGFRIAAEFSSDDTMPWMFHSYALKGEMQISGCRAPWYEKFLFVRTDENSPTLHRHEYVEGCFMNVRLSKSNGIASMWVTDAEGVRVSEILEAKCEC